jgi:hypothetical protein
VYCAKFVHTIHSLKTANFSTLLCYDRVSIIMIVYCGQQVAWNAICTLESGCSSFWMMGIFLYYVGRETLVSMCLLYPVTVAKKIALFFLHSEISVSSAFKSSMICGLLLPKESLNVGFVFGLWKFVFFYSSFVILHIQWPRALKMRLIAMVGFSVPCWKLLWDGILRRLPLRRLVVLFNIHIVVKI